MIDVVTKQLHGLVIGAATKYKSFCHSPFGAKKNKPFPLSIF